MVYNIRIRQFFLIIGGTVDNSFRSKKKTFKNGVHPHDSKELNRDVQLSRMKTPGEIVLSLSQGFGAPSVLIKECGALLKRGELIAEPSSAMGNYIYSPVEGTIKETISITLPSGVNAPAVVITPSYIGEDIDENDYVRLGADLSPLESIKMAGIVGLGGAGFPTHIKYSIKEGQKVDYFIINSIECEPYLCSDYRIGLEKTKECLKGIQEASRILKATNTVIAIEDNKKDLFEKFKEAISSSDDYKNITPVILKTKYPQGDEKNLIATITGREVPSGKLPLDAGCVVSNLGTVFAIYEAIYLRKPLIERVVSVTGDGVATPKNIIAPLGVKISDLVKEAGGFKENGPKKCISGGPMMGFAFYNLDTPITKTTSGVTFLTEVFNDKTTPCISCGRCVNACPMHLLPTRLFKLIANGKYKEAMDENLMDCRECGCCEFSCPSNIKLVQGFKLGKKLGRVQK